MSETCLNLNLNKEEISNLSEELKKLIDENNSIPSEELKEFLNDTTGFERKKVNL